jgi:hypothetical protein
VRQHRTCRVFEREPVEPHAFSRRASYRPARYSAGTRLLRGQGWPSWEPCPILSPANAHSPAALATGPRRLIGPLLLLALALVPVTWWLPLFTARVPFLWRHEVSIAGGLAELWRLDLVLCLTVFFFSVLAPLAKGAALTWVWYRAPTPLAHRLLDRLALLGKLAMAEIFLLAVVIVGLKGVGIGTVETAWGLHAFVAALLLSYAASTWAWASLSPAAAPGSSPP